MISAAWHWLTVSWTWFSDNDSELEVICLALSAIAGFNLLLHTTKISRREKTIEMIKDSLTAGPDGSRPYDEFRFALKEAESSGRDIASYSDWDDPKNDIHETFDRQLNYYELVSLGIRNGVFDEIFYKAWFRSQVMRDHGKLLPYIDAVRRQRGMEFFSEFRWLVTRWERKEHPEASPRLPTLMLWLIQGKYLRVQIALQRQVTRRAARRALAKETQETDV